VGLGAAVLYGADAQLTKSGDVTSLRRLFAFLTGQ